MKRTGLAIATAIVGLALAACSGGSAEPSDSASGGTASGSPAPSASGPFDGTSDAATRAKAIKAAVASATKVTVITADNDPDQVAQPAGSTSVAVISDSAGDTSEPDPGVAWGAAVEVFETAEQAQARSDDIQSILKDAPVLGSEYHYLSGTALLRVSGALTPAAAKAYEAAFMAPA